MPCYVENVEETIGMHKGRVTRFHGGQFIWCDNSDLLSSPSDDHCANCMGFGDSLCDYPVGDDKTCDRKMCDAHRHSVAPDIDYCSAHYQMWLDFSESERETERLRNVIPYRKHSQPK